MHHFPPFQPNPKGTSTTSISVGAPDTPPPSPPSQCPPYSPLSWGAAAAAARGPPPRPRRRETPTTAKEDPGFAPPRPCGPRRRDGACFPGAGSAVVPTLAEIEEEVCSRSREAAGRPRRLRPAKRLRYHPTPVDEAVARPPSPPPSPSPSSAVPRTPARHGTRLLGGPAPLPRSALRTPSFSSASSSSSTCSSSSSEPRKTVRFAAAAPETQFFASWDAPSSLKLLRRTPGRVVPELAGEGGSTRSRGRGRDPLPPSPPPAWHWTLRTPDLPPAAPSSSASSPPPVVQLRDLFLGARRRPSVVLGLVSVAREGDSPVTASGARRAAITPPGAVVCEGTRDGGRTWAAVCAGAAWFCAAPRCDWFQFALDAAGLGLLGGSSNDDEEEEEEEDSAARGGQERAVVAAAASASSHPHNKNNNNALALRVRYCDVDGCQWIDDNHGAGFKVRLELCWAGPVDDVDDWGTPPGKLDWVE